MLWHCIGHAVQYEYVSTTVSTFYGAALVFLLKSLEVAAILFFLSKVKNRRFNADYLRGVLMCTRKDKEEK
jgi:hypothetical protein